MTVWDACNGRISPGGRFGCAGSYAENLRRPLLADTTCTHDSVDNTLVSLYVLKMNGIGEVEQCAVFIEPGAVVPGSAPQDDKVFSGNCSGRRCCLREMAWITGRHATDCSIFLHRVLSWIKRHVEAVHALGSAGFPAAVDFAGRCQITVTEAGRVVLEPGSAAV